METAAIGIIVPVIAIAIVAATVTAIVTVTARRRSFRPAHLPITAADVAMI